METHKIDTLKPISLDSNHLIEIDDLKNLIESQLYKLNETWYNEEGPRKRNIGLISGLSGKILCNFYVGKHTGNDEFLKEGKLLLEYCIDVINDQTFELSNFFSFCNGFTGFCYTLNHLNSHNFITTNFSQEVEEIEKFLFEMGNKALTVEKTDFLHGGIGVLYYFLKNLDKPANRLRASKMIQAYSKVAKFDDLGMRVPNTALLEREPTEYDLGLAHGLSGHLIIFAEAYAMGFEAERCKKLIEQGLVYFENTYKDSRITGYKGSYPVSVIEAIAFDDPKNLAFYDSRLGWCYGDLNYAIMFLKLYEVFKNEDFLDKALLIADRATERISPEKSKIQNVFFCHGSSGVSNIFLQLYRKTRKEKYLKASQKLLSDTISDMDKQLELALEDSKDCLLNGRAGIILTLLSHYNGEADGWNELFLLH